MHLHNANNHAVVLWSYLNNADHSAVLDSARLAVADSNLYSGFLNIPSIEDNFSVTFKSIDHDDGDVQVLPFVSRFTTRGPLSIEHYEIASADTTPNPGDLLQLELYVRNKGNAAIENVRIGLTQIDSCTTPDSRRRSVGSLSGGEVKAASGALTVLIASGCEAPSTLPVQADIYEGNNLFWVDTLYIELNPVITGIADRDAPPLEFNLQQNYPNPFNPTTTVEFHLPRAEFVTLKIYNILGKEVEKLVSQKLPSGKYDYEWDASGMKSGVYFYKIQAGNEVAVRKMVLLK